jgi:cell division protein FtsW (lipid II flippase)
MDNLKRTEKQLFLITLVACIINCFGLIGHMHVENAFLVLSCSLVLAILALIGLSRMNKDINEEKRHDYIFNLLYMDISLGICSCFLIISPRLLERGIMVISLLANIILILLGLYILFQEKIVNKQTRWM